MMESIESLEGNEVKGQPELIMQGAEARIYLGNFLGRKSIIKERFRKTYRHPTLDDRLTKERMRGELRGITRCKSIGIRTPAVYAVDSKYNAIHMEYMENVDTVNIYIGKLLQGCSTGEGEMDCNSKLKALGYEIGLSIGKMHSAGIIHGDLTTSNILIHASMSPDDKPTLCLIDFGLSHVENSAEDKAVDLYVLERALTATFSSIPWFFEVLMDAYRNVYVNGSTEVSEKLEEVRLRGRKRTMVG